MVIRRKKLTIFTDVKESTKVIEVKKIIEGVTKIAPRNQQLFSRENQLMDDVKSISYYGFNSHSAKPESPASIGLAVRLDNGDFETLEVTTYSNPPDLPDVMKSSECNGIDQTI